MDRITARPLTTPTRRGRWQHTVDIKDILREYEETEDLQTVGKKVIEKLKASGLFGEESDRYDLVIYELEDAVEVNEVDDFDYALARLYEECDDRRIWLGI